MDFNSQDFNAPPQKTVIQTKSGGKAMPFFAGMLSGCMTAVLLCIFCTLLFGYGCYKLVSSSTDSLDSLGKGNSGFGEKVLVHGDGDRRIALVKIHGVITGSENSLFTDDNLASSAKICALLRELREDDSVCAIILDLNTPGGEVVASDDIRLEVDKCRREGIPVVALMRAMAASGGYYIGSGADWIVANPVCITGSIGVIMSGLEYHGLLDKIGVKPMVYRSGEFKDIGSGMREPTEPERKYMQGLIDETFLRFCQVVADGRPQYPTADAVRQAEFGDGRPVSGRAALEYGLVDQLGALDEAVAKARELGGEPDAEVFRPTRFGKDFWESFLSSGMARQPLRLEGLTGNRAALKPGVMYYILPEALP